MESSKELLEELATLTEQHAGFSAAFGHALPTYELLILNTKILITVLSRLENGIHVDTDDGRYP